MMTPFVRPMGRRAPRAMVIWLATRLLLLGVLLWAVFPARATDGMGAVLDGPIARHPWLLPAVALATVCLAIFACSVIGHQRRSTAGGRRPRRS